jgi:hypothetical protein
MKLSGQTWWLMPIVLATQKAETGISWFKASLGKSYGDTISKTSQEWWHMPIFPTAQGAEVGGLPFKASQEKSAKPHLKYRRGKRTWLQFTCLPSARP